MIHNIRHQRTKFCWKRTWRPGFVHPWFRIHNIRRWNATHSPFFWRCRGALPFLCSGDETNVPYPSYILSLMFVLQRLKCFRIPSCFCSIIYLFFVFSTRRKGKTWHCINFRLRLKGPRVFLSLPHYDSNNVSKGKANAGDVLQNASEWVYINRLLEFLLWFFPIENYTLS